MNSNRTFHIAGGADVCDLQLQRLLTTVYVGGGYLSDGQATKAFEPATVRARGELRVALDSGGALLGTVIVVAPGSPARRLAGPGEAELALLAVGSSHRGAGVGAALVVAAVNKAREMGARSMILWTRPTMQAAQRIYERAGFVHVPDRDFVRAGTAFMVFSLPL